MFATYLVLMVIPHTVSYSGGAYLALKSGEMGLAIALALMAVIMFVVAFAAGEGIPNKRSFHHASVEAVIRGKTSFNKITCFSISFP